ncbi:MAG: aromatic amino acid transport family protein [Alphaproteobacteria bacterium]
MSQNLNVSLINIDDKKLSIPVEKSQQQFWGALFVVAGTTIGAGMLALPMSVASLGILGGSLLLSALWGVMYLSATIALDLNIHAKIGSSIAKLSNDNLGKAAGLIGAATLVLMLNALLVAYTSGASSLIKTIVDTYTNISISQPMTMTIFTIAMAALVCIDMKILDTGNRIFFAIMMFVFLAMMAVLFGKIQISKPMLGIQEPGVSPWLIAVPLFFTSFGFHGSIPSLVNYCESRSNIIKSAFFWGSFVPLLIYLIWIIGGLSIVYTYDHAVFTKLVNNEADLGVFILSLSNTIDTPWLQSFSWIFSLLAIITSFLGVAIGLFDYYREQLTQVKEKHQRIVSCVFALGVPLLVTLLAKETFMHVLGFAGIFLSILAVVLPCIIWLKLQHNPKFSTQINPVLVKVLLTIGIIVICCEVYNICF